uniref:Phosphoglycerate mutase (2,3-diphosphoglycerate-dependent) n=1 Tax=Dunaliella tertiolecta TaxID=3047 RepID=A0A7S3VJ79_DUNTE|mmetsp:Transcript_15433/g.41776  ORF Transcript_15433/g.41776 Transcript_15433/m.41776 type:complete len:439 (+) Transcript_15433:33-1349(+)
MLSKHHAANALPMASPGRALLLSKRMSSPLHLPRAVTQEVDQWQDEFTPLQDRRSDPPLPLPPISKPKAVVIVRHGQSTWNAESRVQGSSDASVLTPKGIAQAEASAKMLASDRFDAAYTSPLERASLTAEYVWGSRPTPCFVDPVLREIDLYDFQGMLKTEVKQQYPAEREAWQTAPNDFVLSGHFPVKELWYRASLAWQRILAEPADADRLLVVAHNNTNQGLLCTALGLPATYFRRLTQSNAAASVLSITPSTQPQGTPTATLECLNRSTTNNPFKKGEKVLGRITLLVPSNNVDKDSVCAAFMAMTKVDSILYAQGHEHFAHQAAQAQTGQCQPGVGTLQGEEGMACAWAQLVENACSREGGQHIVAVMDDRAAVQMLGQAMDLEPHRSPQVFRCSPGSCSVLDITYLSPRPFTVANCINLKSEEMALVMASRK